MHLGRTAGKRTLVFGWIKTILMLLVFYLPLTFLLYHLAEGIIEEQITAINSGLAAEIRSRMETQLTETRAIGTEVANAPYASALTGSPSENITEFSWAYRDMVEYFRITEATHTFIKTVSILFNQSGFTVTSDGIFSLPGKTQKYIDAFIQKVSNRPDWNRFDWALDENGTFAYMQMLSQDSTGETSVLLVAFNREGQTAYLKEIPKKYGGVQFIIDNKGNLLFSSDENIGSEILQEVSRRAVSLSDSVILKGIGAFAVTQTELANLFCCSFIPEPLYMSELRQLRSIFLIIAAAAVGLGLVLAVYFITVHYRPLIKIIDRFENSIDTIPKRGNEYERIEEYSNHLLAANRINREQLRRVEEDMNSRLLEGLLKGNLAYANIPETLKIPASTNASGSFFLGYLKLAGSCFPSEVLRLYVSEVSAVLPEGWKRLFLVFIDQAAVLLLSGEGTPAERLEELLKHLDAQGEKLTARTGFTPLAVVSLPFTAAEEIRSQYLQCHRKMEEAEFFMTENTLVADSEDTGGFLYLDQDDQKKLSEAVREGRYENAEERIGRIIEYIESGEGISTAAARCILFTTLTTVIQTVSSSPAGTGEFMATCNDLIVDFFSSEDIRSMKESLERIIKASCEEISGRKRDHTKRLFQEIKAYVKNHLADREMYLPSLAEHFGMNPKYLTVFFKENQGTPLAEYIRQVRIDQACKLILDGNPIKIAAEKTGFSNIISFNRVFKRLKKMTPTEFRRTAILNK
ncbi:MAG: AraC family transcriptional regulator [Spirochaetales bacterium]|nr:AraC family transcriptional regulator [Spirochaetales bacterium]